MIVFDIPLLPAHDAWNVDLPSGSRRFFTRHEALQFAAAEASRLTRSGQCAFLSIEGSDGRWRLFGPDLKAPVIPEPHREGNAHRR